MDDKKKVGLSVVIPIYNESETLPSLFARLVEVVDKADHPIEFILVDGFSTDDSAKVLDNLLSGSSSGWAPYRTSATRGRAPAPHIWSTCVLSLKSQRGVHLTV